MGNCNCTSLKEENSEVYEAPLVPPITSNEEQILESSHLRIFSYEELKIATKQFGNKSKLAIGGFGCVYRGRIWDTNNRKRVEVAVKRIASGYIFVLAVQTEIKYLGDLRHPNLIRLIGYCREERNRVLVYEFMKRGSLEECLIKRATDLSWNHRMKAVLGAARGLSFLHSEMNRNPTIIYRDFKSANVLLDSVSDTSYCSVLMFFFFSFQKALTLFFCQQNYNAKLSDFGIVTPKSDVYCFGAVLVEVLSGRLASNQHKLVEWAKPNLNPTRLSFVLDHRLGQKYSLNETREVAALALRCLDEDYMNRPFMAEVLEELEQAIHG
ncbi:putative serine/threonine-protein kinase NAK [Acorus gramineus]|uniref:Serine/threonine-protein kinase NAK n=1 Tax=Acorus gramineus TaxID=55184 RepID=A0AAV9ANI2_ACOGR|nr:putative serine/threonine-protein kinase NAK [Acorus gramineus]